MKLWLLTLVSSLAACGGGRTPLDPGLLGRASGAGGTGMPSLGNPQPTGGNTGTGPGIDDAGNGACHGTCLTPPGPVELYPSLDDLAAALVGVWQICSGGPALFDGAPSDTIGVEFTPSSVSTYGAFVGALFFLKSSPAGPVRGDGPAYQQRYQVADDMTVSCRSADDKHGSWFELMYSSCPREWWFEIPGGRSGTLASF